MLPTIRDSLDTWPLGVDTCHLISNDQRYILPDTAVLNLSLLCPKPP